MIARCFSSTTVARGCVSSLSKNREDLWMGSLCYSTSSVVPSTFPCKKKAYASGPLTYYMYMYMWYTYMHIHVCVAT